MTKRSYIIILAFLLIFSAVLAVGSTTMLPTANAAVLTSDKNFDETEIEDDLGGIDLALYPANPLGRLAVFELIEYCYSDNAFRQGNYGIYIYLYNPQQINFSTKVGASTVNIATEYNEAGEPSGYSNLKLSFLDKTDDGVFYKFKVSNPIRLLENATAHSKEYGNRRYDVAGIQLRELGQATSTDYGIGGSYVFTGYAAGYGSDTSAESTLDCEIKEFETLSLDVKHTYYRSAESSEPTSGSDNGNLYDQLNSVYFSVPNNLLERYGDLYAIHAEWWEYRTKPIFVTGNADVFNHLKNYIGYQISASTGELGDQLCFSSDVKYGFAADYWHNYDQLGGHFSALDYAYNLNSELGKRPTSTNMRDGYFDVLYYLFLSDKSSAGDYILSGEKLQRYITDYSEGKSDLINGKYARELFTEDVGEGHNPGYIDKTIYSDDSFSLESIPLQGFFEKFFGLHKDTEYNNVQAIQRITDTDFAGGNAESVSKALYIAENDYTDFKLYYDLAKSKDETVFLFRFALSDYYSAQCAEFDGSEDNQSFKGDYIDTNVYMSMQNVFLDFDIIDTTFNRDGKYTVIPVVSDPIDIISDITPPSDFKKESDCNGISLFTILMIILAVLAFVMLLPLLPTILTFLVNVIVFIFKGIFFILSLPFKAGKAIAKKIKERKAAKAAKPPKSKTKAKAKAKPKRRSAAKVKYPKYKVKGYRYEKRK